MRRPFRSGKKEAWDDNFFRKGHRRAGEAVQDFIARRENEYECLTALSGATALFKDAGMVATGVAAIPAGAVESLGPLSFTAPVRVPCWLCLLTWPSNRRP